MRLLLPLLMGLWLWLTPTLARAQDDFAALEKTVRGTVFLSATVGDYIRIGFVESEVRLRLVPGKARWQLEGRAPCDKAQLDLDRLVELRGSDKAWTNPEGTIAYTREIAPLTGDSPALAKLITELKDLARAGRDYLIHKSDALPKTLGQAAAPAPGNSSEAVSKLRADLQATSLPFTEASSDEFLVRFSYETAKRGQTVRVQVRVDEYLSLHVRELRTYVWIGKTKPTPERMKELLLNRTKAGSWRLTQFADGDWGIYLAILVDGNAPAGVLADYLRLTAAAGDELEKHLDPVDRW